MPYRARTNIACRVARVNPDRFNEIVASGDYPCAPQTTPGVARVFEEIDMIALRLFAMETESGTAAKTAGSLACRVHGVLQQHPDTNRVYLSRTTEGVNYQAAVENVNLESEQFGPGMPLHRTIIIHVGNIREQVRRALDDERSIIGDE